MNKTADEQLAVKYGVLKGLLKNQISATERELEIEYKNYDFLVNLEIAHNHPLRIISKDKTRVINDLMAVLRRIDKLETHLESLVFIYDDSIN